MESCSGKFAKFILIIFNIIFALSGIAILAVGIIILTNTDIKNFDEIANDYLSNGALTYAAWGMVIFGGFVLLISILGFCGGITENKILLSLYIFFLVIIFLGELSAGIAAAVFKKKIENELETKISDGFTKNYNDTIGAWDFFQENLQCCGSSNYTDYKYVNLTAPPKTMKYYVPSSCCNSTNVAGCQTEAQPMKYDPSKKYGPLYAIGCFSQFNDLLKDNIGIIIGSGFGIAMIQVIGVVLACCVCRSDNEVGAV